MKNSILNKLYSARRISLFGYGKSNRAVHSFLKKRCPSASFSLRCDGTADLSADELSEFDAVYEGKQARCRIDEDIIFLSPTVRRDSQEIIAATQNGATLLSDIELFFALNDGDSLGITGSDGKSTTTRLTADILTSAGLAAAPLGNFGRSPLTILGSRVFPVLELSSFQLMGIRPRLRRACITNITKNHLNWHKSFDEYIDAKLNIIRNTDEAVYDYDSEVLRTAASGIRAFAVCSSRLSHSELIKRCDTLHTLTLCGEEMLIDGERSISLAEARRKESYNFKNYMLSTAMTLGLANEAQQSDALIGFAGLAHRCELVDEIGGVRYYNSSIDTSQKRTLSTLDSLQGEITLILTGRPKDKDIGELASAIRKRGIRVIIFGECTEAYKDALADADVTPVCDMYSAVATGAHMTAIGGAVLLSPSATGYDLYKSFEERGEDFCRCVIKYKELRKGKRK